MYNTREALTYSRVYGYVVIREDKTENISLEIVEVILLWFERASFFSVRGMILYDFTFLSLFD